MCFQRTTLHEFSDISSLERTSTHPCEDLHAEVDCPKDTRRHWLCLVSEYFAVRNTTLGAGMNLLSKWYTLGYFPLETLVECGRELKDQYYT